jgi:hypothetical protein
MCVSTDGDCRVVVIADGPGGTARATTPIERAYGDAPIEGVTCEDPGNWVGRGTWPFPWGSEPVLYRLLTAEEEEYQRRVGGPY